MSQISQLKDTPPYSLKGQSTPECLHAPVCKENQKLWFSPFYRKASGKFSNVFLAFSLLEEYQIAPLKFF